MATTFQNKINDLEARLIAENESRANDPMLRSLNSDNPSPRRPSPFDNFKGQNTGPEWKRGAAPTVGGQNTRHDRTASPGAPPIPPRRRIQSPAVPRNFGGNENFNRTVDLPQNLSQTVPYVNTRHQQHQRSVSVERSSFSDTHAYYRHSRVSTGSQPGSGIPVSSTRGRLLSANNDTTHKQSKRTPQVPTAFVVNKNSVDKSSSPRPSKTTLVNSGDNQTGLGFENNFADILDIPKSTAAKPTLVRKKSDLDKPRVDIPPGATYNPQSSKKVILPQGRTNNGYEATKAGRNSPRYGSSLKKGIGHPSPTIGSKTTSAGSFDDSFDTSWAKSSLPQSKSSAIGLPQSDASTRHSGIPRAPSQRSSFDNELAISQSPGRSPGFSQVNQHVNSPGRSSSIEPPSPRALLQHRVGTIELSVDRNNSSATTQDIHRQSNRVPGNTVNLSSQQETVGLPKQNSDNDPSRFNSMSMPANAGQVHSPKYVSSINTSIPSYISFDNGTENDMQQTHVNGGMTNVDRQQRVPMGSQKKIRPTDMFKQANSTSGPHPSFLQTSDVTGNISQSIPLNGPGSHSDSPLHNVVTPMSRGEQVEQIHRPELASDINTNNTSCIPQPQSSPRNSKSAIPRPNRPTLNFGAVPAPVSNRHYMDINARNNNNNVGDYNMTNGPIVDTGQRVSTGSRGQMAWNSTQGSVTVNRPVVDYGSVSLTSHMTSPPMITSPPYHQLYERQTQSPRSLSSGSPSSVRSQSSTPTPTRPSLNFGSRMTSPGLNLPIRHIPTSVSSCDMSFESPDSPGSLSLPGRPSFISSPSSPGGATVPLRPGSAGTPAPLNFSNPGIMRKKKEFHLPMSSGHSRTPDVNEIEMKYQEIMKRCGILTLDSKRIPTNIHELEHVCDLGHGTCGHVVKMRHMHTHHVMAVKQMRRSGNRDENKRIIMDLDVVVKSHNCPYIVRCIGTFVTSTDVWICMELMSTCLEKLLKKLRAPIPEEILGKVAVATVNALHYLKEEHGVIHRDIKPSNILLNENGDIKLCDFGISGRLVDSKAKTRSAGCAAYMAPERIDPPDPTRPDYDIRADVWSLGISLVELATGAFPYKNCKTDFEVLTRVLQEDPPVLPPGEGFSLDLCSFVWHCLTKDYKKRPKYRELLKHPFIQRYINTAVDVAFWYTSVLQQIGPPTPITGKPGLQ